MQAHITIKCLTYDLMRTDIRALPRGYAIEDSTLCARLFTETKRLPKAFTRRAQRYAQERGIKALLQIFTWKGAQEILSVRATTIQSPGLG